MAEGKILDTVKIVRGFIIEKLWDWRDKLKGIRGFVFEKFWD